MYSLLVYMLRRLPCYIPTAKVLIIFQVFAFNTNHKPKDNFNRSCSDSPKYLLSFNLVSKYRVSLPTLNIMSGIYLNKESKWKYIFYLKGPWCSQPRNTGILLTFSWLLANNGFEEDIDLVWIFLWCVNMPDATVM